MILTPVLVTQFSGRIRLFLERTENFDKKGRDLKKGTPSPLHDFEQYTRKQLIATQNSPACSTLPHTAVALCNKSQKRHSTPRSLLPRDRVAQACGKVEFTMVIEVSRFCSDRMVITIQSREAQSRRRPMCSVPKAHNVTAQGNALGKCETNVLSPNGAKWSWPAYALSGLSCSRLPVSWGDAPGFHMLPRCGKIFRTRDLW